MKMHAYATEKGWWDHVSQSWGVTKTQLAAQVMMVVTELAEAVQAIRDPDVRWRTSAGSMRGGTIGMEGSGCE